MIRPEPDCSLCGLCEGRHNLVLPDGNYDSPVVFVGEAPGENEDLEGRPFIGRSGKLLTNMMEDAGIARSSILITNTVKCRPPKNRDPTAEEMEICRPFLNSELKGRSLIVGLGKSACRDLLGYEGKMGDIVNKITTIVIDGEEIDFLPTYHPAACIYNKQARVNLRAAMDIVKERL